IPPRNEHITTLYYCFENLSELTYGRNTVAFALNSTWKRYANINFVDEGNCSSAAHASSAVRIDGWDQVGGLVERFGKEIAGVVNGLHVSRNDALLQQSCPGVAPNVCFQWLIAHEFGHALGFYHEHLRADWDPTICNSPGVTFTRQFITPDQLADTLITGWDVNSIMEMSYCRPASGATMSASDVAGVAAIYGATSKQQGTAYVLYQGQKAVRFQNISRWLQPTDTAAANVQTFVGDWERVRFNRIGGAAADGAVHYGDEVSISDRFSRFLSGRNDFNVNMQGQRADWERWRVETIDNARYPNGSKVQVNAPLRLKNIAFNRWLGVTTSGDVLLTNATSTTELRINGNFVTR
ncbi:MAG TPA: M12 family metallopeptidase, partial [Polyangiales bacterium]|nr:M12 family metallopeptidase [Polyangiales bacterium]